MATRAQQLTDQIATLVGQLKAELAALPGPIDPPVDPPPTGDFITKAVDLARACENGGSFRIAPGAYLGNFVIRKPLTLVGAKDVVLQPLDQLLPTLEVASRNVIVKGITIKNGAPDRECVVVGSIEATAASMQPDNVVLDSVDVVAGLKGGHRGIALHGSNLIVRDSRVTGFWEAGRDSQAIWIMNGPGPYVIERNYLEASGETILTGGDSIKIPGCVPSDIHIIGNTCYKPDAWRSNGATVKNAIEIKIGRRVRIEDNIVDGNWSSGQDGTPILLTTRNQYGDNPWSIIEEVTISRNVTKRCKEGYAISILGADDTEKSQQAKSVSIDHNLFMDSPNGIKIGNAVATALVILNNTLPVIKSNFLQFYDSRATIVKSPLQFEANVLKSGAYGISGTNLAPGLPTLTAFTTIVSFARNVIEKTAAREIPYPPGNTLIAPGSLASKLDPATSKYLPDSALGI